MLSDFKNGILSKVDFKIGCNLRKILLQIDKINYVKKHKIIQNIYINSAVTNTVVIF